MPLDLANVHVTTALTDISVAFGKGTYMADALAPRVMVKHQFNTYFIWDVLREAHRVGQSGRAPGTAATFVEAKNTTDTYSCTDHAHNALVTDEERSNADAAIDPEIDAVEVARRKLLVEKDVALKALLDASGASSATPGTLWDVDGDAVEDVLTGVQNLIAGTQENRITMGMSGQVMRKLLTNATIVNRILAAGSSTDPARVNLQAFAQVFNVNEVIVADAYQNTASVGDTAVMADIWANDVYLVVKPERPRLKTLSGAYTFTWNPLKGGRSEEGQFVHKVRKQLQFSDVFGVHDYYDQKIVSSAAIYLLQNVIS